MRVLIGFLFTVIFCFPGLAQTAPSSQLLLENNHFRATLIKIPEGGTTTVQSKSRGAVIIAITDLTSAQNEVMPSGQIEYLTPKSGQKAIAARTTEGRLLVVDLLEDYENVQPCQAPRQCSRPIRMEDQEVGQSEFVLRGGGLTVDRHKLVQGASLTSNYYTARTKSHVLIAALTDLEANFAGDFQNLKAGQVYFTDEEQADITAGKGGARWVAIRVVDKSPASTPK